MYGFDSHHPLQRLAKIAGTFYHAVLRIVACTLLTETDVRINGHPVPCADDEEAGKTLTAGIQAMGKSSEFWNFFDGEAAPKLALRASTFRKMFEYLDRLDAPINIIETGCARFKDDWSAEGQSTFLFDKYIHHHAAESKLYSVDINKSATDYARTFVGPKTALTCDDSVRYLARLTADFLAHGQTADLVYLDAYDLDWHYWYPSAAHHLMELCSVLRILRTDTLVVIDDCAISASFVRGNNNTINFVSPPIIGGKGRLVAEFAARVGAKTEFSEYQAGWSGF